MTEASRSTKPSNKSGMCFAQIVCVKEMKNFLKYLLIQAPQWLTLALFLWFLIDRTALPMWATVAFFLFWVIKDLVVFPWVRRAYSNEAKTGTERLIGALALVEQRLDPEGYVKLNGELWKVRARFDQEVPEGTVIRVCGANGLTLIVDPQIETAEAERTVA
jgi:membrane protein implicated in regulation of membrane protease activity